MDRSGGWIAGDADATLGREGWGAVDGGSGSGWGRFFVMDDEEGLLIGGWGAGRGVFGGEAAGGSGDLGGGAPFLFLGNGAEEAEEEPDGEDDQAAVAVGVGQGKDGREDGHQWAAGEESAAERDSRMEVSAMMFCMRR